MQVKHATPTPRARRAHSSERRRTVLALAIPALFSLAATACGSDGMLGPGIGSGSVTATGAVNTSGSGLALFQSASSGGTSLFQVLIAPLSQTTASTWQLQIVNYSGRLAAGTYTLSALSASSPDPTANFYYTSGSTMDMYNSISGELVITASSSASVRGTFTFTATNASGGTGSVTVNGSFTAECAPGMTCE
jgi:hypothetical protein